MRIFACAVLTAALWCGQAQAQSLGNYLECSACQLVLGMVQNSMDDEKGAIADASRQCALLEPKDRAACEAFQASMTPKFLKAFRERLARGESLEAICRAMRYCR